jgi:Plant transposon protein
VPGAKNDLLILEMSPLFQRLRTGKWPPLRPDIDICGFRLTWFFYLTDSIYPGWRIFVTTYNDRRTRKQKNFRCHQEAVRKGLEVVFGVLFARFCILREPKRLWYRENMKIVIKTCEIRHNQVILARKQNYTGTSSARNRVDEFDANGGEANNSISAQHRMPGDEFERLSWLDEHVSPIENDRMHKELKAALTEYLWIMKGNIAHEDGAPSSGEDFDCTGQQETVDIDKDSDTTD